MGIRSFLEAIKEFFLDVIGTIIPGSLFLFYLSNFVKSVSFEGVYLSKFYVSWPFFIAASYVLGNGILGVSYKLDELVRKTLSKAPGWLRDVLTVGKVQSKKELLEKISESESYKRFREYMEDPVSEEDSPYNVHSWRSEAMTIAKDEKHVVYRFMFIHLFHKGIATILVVSPILWIIVSIFDDKIPFAVNKISITEGLVVLLVSLLSSFPFWGRSFRFYARSMRVPFSMANSTIKEQ